MVLKLQSKESKGKLNKQGGNRQITPTDAVTFQAIRISTASVGDERESRRYARLTITLSGGALLAS